MLHRTAVSYGYRNCTGNVKYRYELQEDREEKQAAIKRFEIAGMIYAKGLHEQVAVILKSDAYTCSLSYSSMYNAGHESCFDC